MRLACEENSMLKISFSETPSEERWILHGRLAAPSIREFRAAWKKHHQNDGQRACLVDLDDVTFIDKSGMRLVRMPAKAGARYNPRAVETKHVIEQLHLSKKHG